MLDGQKSKNERNGRDTCELQPWNEKTLAPGSKSYDQPGQHIKKQRHHFADKGPSSQSYDFSSSHTEMGDLDHRKGWVPKNWCFQTVVLEKTLGSPLDNKEIKPISPEGNLPWIFIGNTDDETEASLLHHLMWRVIRWKRPRGWEKLKAKKGDDTGWDGWMASLTQWTWVWASSGRLWRTEEPGVLWSTGPQRVRHDLAPEQQEALEQDWELCLDGVGQGVLLWIGRHMQAGEKLSHVSLLWWWALLCRNELHSFPFCLDCQEDENKSDGRLWSPWS